jgi:uncharacterized protein (DUF1330 family)
MPTIIPTSEQIQDFLATDDGGSFVMLNLLRFKDVADGVNEGEGITGAEAYGRYAVGTQPFLERVGGQLLHAVASQQTVVGPGEKEWDMVLLVEYPSRAKFMEMATDPEYLEVHKHRDSALADSRIVACAPVALG